MTYHFSKHLLAQLNTSTRSGIRGALHVTTAILLATSCVSVSAQETLKPSATDTSWEDIAAIKAQLDQEKRHIQALRLTRQKIQFDNGTQAQTISPSKITVTWLLWSVCRQKARVAKHYLFPTVCSRLISTNKFKPKAHSKARFSKKLTT